MTYYYNAYEYNVHPTCAMYIVLYIGAFAPIRVYKIHLYT